jgi:hypothetical protein
VRAQLLIVGRSLLRREQHVSGGLYLRQHAFGRFALRSAAVSGDLCHRLFGRFGDDRRFRFKILQSE